MTDELFPGAPVIAPPAADAPRRGIGVASLVLALVPLAGGALLAAFTAWTFATFEGDLLTGIAAVFGVVALAVLVSASGILCGALAIALGILAVRRDRGRAQGRAGLVIGSIVLAADLVLIVIALVTTSIGAGDGSGMVA